MTCERSAMAEAWCPRMRRADCPGVALFYIGGLVVCEPCARMAIALHPELDPYVYAMLEGGLWHPRDAMRDATWEVRP